MAVPYTVNGFNVSEITDQDGIKRVHLDADLTNAKGNRVSKEYWMVGDTRATNQSIVNDINHGFSHSIDNLSKVKISVAERIYLFFYLPSDDGEILRQYTGSEIK
ncbi:hypothetical protein [Pectobacterium versatile]|uniref:hypothetical protein n=1 Tax=Pectobacterium versatile TaxID=2488639 RepID=UPI001CD18B7B|nr:hypothetical protein [Pectobacterium versatile]